MTDEPEPVDSRAAVAFGLAMAVCASWLDRVLALVAPASFMRAVVYAGRIAHEKPLLGATGGVARSYAFLGQEALADALHLVLALLALRHVRRTLPRPFALDGPTALTTAKVGGATAGLIALSAIVGGLVAARVEGGAPLRAFLDRLDIPLLAHPVGLLLALAGFLFTAPLAEEIVFRGLVYRALRRRLSVPMAAVVQAGFFAACHLDTGLAPPLIAIPYVWGIAAAVLLERTGSLGAAVLLHALGNAGGLLVVAAVMGYPAEIYALLGGR